MIEKFVSGNECGIRTNIYTVSNDKNEAILIDTSYNFDSLLEEINYFRGLEILAPRP